MYQNKLLTADSSCYFDVISLTEVLFNVSVCAIYSWYSARYDLYCVVVPYKAAGKPIQTCSTGHVLANIRRCIRKHEYTLFYIKKTFCSIGFRLRMSFIIVRLLYTDLWYTFKQEQIHTTHIFISSIYLSSH